MRRALAFAVMICTSTVALSQAPMLKERETLWARCGLQFKIWSPGDPHRTAGFFFDPAFDGSIVRYDNAEGAPKLYLECVLNNQAAFLSGLRKGDRIITVNDKVLGRPKIDISEKRPLSVVIERNGARQTLEIQ